ncbi:sulfatase [Acidovorax sacchari]|uniref:sulfatase family protein n=1 Tax=Acidovorax sacchari TaxID=3230736 RepID=UPI0039E6FF01
MSQEKRPNLIFILADDLGYADLGCTGARDAEGRPADITPHLDRIASGGVRFTRGYSNSSVCSPTRFALATGRWQYRLRGGAEEPIPTVSQDKVLGLPPEHPTLPSLLRDTGYTTALIGKWHLGYPPHFSPRLSGYQHFYGFHAGGNDYFAHCNPKGQPDLWENETEIREEGYLTDILSQRAVAFIEQQPADRPFLLSLHYSAPHWPWLTRDDAAESRRIAGVGKHLDGGSIETYQRMIHHMDEGIGWVMEALQRRGMDENTLVVFTSDNGGERFSNNWPLVGQKMDLLEGGIRVPLIARWPARMPAGSVSDIPNMTMDWTATLLDAAGARCHDDYPLDGVSLLPALCDGEPAKTRDLFWRMTHLRQKAVVRGDWKYLQVEENEYLFNLGEDVRERANLRSRYPDIFQELKTSWERWNDSLPPIPEDARAYLVFTEKDLPRASF